jgi:hypothetical protein
VPGVRSSAAPPGAACDGVRSASPLIELDGGRPALADLRAYAELAAALGYRYQAACERHFSELFGLLDRAR